MYKTITPPPLSVRCRLWGTMAWITEELQALGRPVSKARSLELRTRATRLLLGGMTAADTANVLVHEELEATHGRA
jgi:hypothetical protein